MNVLEELVDSENLVDRLYVERRVADWRSRINVLFDQVEAWLPTGWTTSIGGYVPFNEELMRRFELSPEKLPFLRLESAQEQARLEPRGLWIIGANGRLDLIRQQNHHLIIDRSEAFDEPDWQVASMMDRRSERPWSALVLRDLLA